MRNPRKNSLVRVTTAEGECFMGFFVSRHDDVVILHAALPVNPEMVEVKKRVVVAPLIVRNCSNLSSGKELIPYYHQLLIEASEWAID